MSSNSLWNPLMFSVFREPRRFKGDGGGDGGGSSGGGSGSAVAPAARGYRGGGGPEADMGYSGSGGGSSGGGSGGSGGSRGGGGYRGGGGPEADMGYSGGYSGGSATSSGGSATSAMTNQDRINDIYAESSDPWGTNGAELSSLTSNRSATYGGNSTAAATSSSSSAPAETFGNAFATNRAAGNATFSYNGNLYSTDLASDPTKNQGLVDAYNAIADDDESYTPSAATLADVLESQGKTSAITGSLSVADQVAQYDVLGDLDARDAATTASNNASAGRSLQDFSYNSGLTTSAGGANNTTDALLDLSAGMATGKVGLDEATATLALIQGTPLTSRDINALMPDLGVSSVPTSSVSSVEPGSFAAILGLTPEQVAALVAKSDSTLDYTTENILANPLGNPPTNELNSLALDSAITKGLAALIENAGSITEAFGRATTPSLSSVGYGAGMVDPSLASAIPGTIPGQDQVASNLSNSVVDFGKEIKGLGDILGNRVSDNIQGSPRTSAAATGDISLFSKAGRDALAFQTLQALTSTTPTIASLGIGPVTALATGLASTGGEIATQASDEAFAIAKDYGLSDAQAQAIADEAGKQGGIAGIPIGALDAAFSPFGLSKGVVAGVVTEALQEGLFEPTAGSSVAGGVVGNALGRNDLNYTSQGVQTDRNAAIVGGIIGGGVTAGAQAAQSGAGPGSGAGLESIGSIDPSTGGLYGSEATAAASGSLNTNLSSTSGEIAKSTVENAYDQAAESMLEAKVKGVGGGSTATSMDVIAASDIISSEVALTGELSDETARSIQKATDMSMQEINDIATNSGAGDINDIAYWGTQGAGDINGSNDVNLAKDTTTTEVNGINITRTGDSSAAEVAAAEVAAAEQAAAEQAAAEQAAAEVAAAEVAAADVSSAATTDVTTDATTDVTTDATTDVSTEVIPDATTDVTTDATTDVSTEVIPDATTDVATDVTPSVVTSVNVDEPDEDVVVELDEEEEEEEEEEVTADPGTGTDILIPTTTSRDSDGNIVHTCPEGYKLVEDDDGPMCQKTTTVRSSRQRAGAGTRAYTGLSGNRGRSSPGQRRRTTTSSTSERVAPTTTRA